MAPWRSGLGSMAWANSKDWSGLRVRLVSKQMARMEWMLFPRMTWSKESTLIGTIPRFYPFFGQFQGNYPGKYIAYKNHLQEAKRLILTRDICAFTSLGSKNTAPGTPRLAQAAAVARRRHWESSQPRSRPRANPPKKASPQPTGETSPRGVGRGAA